LPGANTLAYLASSSATKKKSFITLTPGWATFGEVEWVSMETYRKIMEVNVFGLIRGIQGRG
jgi:hypothetical protein